MHFNSSNNLGHGGGGPVVSVLAFSSVNPSSNPDETHSFVCKICV